jgi:hypothetical protein
MAKMFLMIQAKSVIAISFRQFYDLLVMPYFLFSRRPYSTTLPHVLFSFNPPSAEVGRVNSLVLPFARLNKQTTSAEGPNKRLVACTNHHPLISGAST